METKYLTGMPGDYNNCIVHNISGLDSVSINIRPKNNTFTYLSLIDIGITGTLPPTPTVNISNATITLPKDSVELIPNIQENGIPITSYTWSQVSGPGTGIIRNPFGANTVVAGLTNGTYIFRLKLTTATSNIQGDVKITVMPNNNNKPTMRVFFSKTEATPVPGWVNMFGDPNASLITVQDPATSWMVNSVGVGYPAWVPFFGANGSNADGTVTGDNSGVVPDLVLKGFWYTANVYTSDHNLKVSGLNPAKRYRLTMVASRSSSGGATAPRSGYYSINGGTAQFHDAFMNTSRSTMFTNIAPDSSGRIFVDLFIPPGTSAYGSMSYLNALIIQEE